METKPCLLSISPNMADSRDDFPEPTWPTTATREPVFTFMLILCRHGEPSCDQEKNPPSITTSSPSGNITWVYMVPRHTTTTWCHIVGVVLVSTHGPTLFYVLKYSSTTQFTMVPKRVSMWFHVVPRFLHMVLCGLKWFCIDKHGFSWVNMVLHGENGSTWGKMVPKWGSIWFHLVPEDSMWFNMVLHW